MDDRLDQNITTVLWFCKRTLLFLGNTCCSTRVKGKDIQPTLKWFQKECVLCAEYKWHINNRSVNVCLFLRETKV